MSHVHPKPNWETRLGLGLIGGLLAVLGFVAWQKIDALLGVAKPGKDEEVAQAIDPAPVERPVGKRPHENRPFVARPGAARSEMPAPTIPAFVETPAPSADVRQSPARILGLREAPSTEPPPHESLESTPDFDSPTEFERQPHFATESTADPAADMSAVEEPRAEGIVTEEGDSFWRIAERAYGDGAWYKALYAHNRDRFPFPDRLAAGETVDAPPTGVLRELYPEHSPEPRRNSPPIARLSVETPTSEAPSDDTISRQSYTESQPPSESVDRLGGRTHVVRDGETLAQIAHEALGDRSRWTEIYRLNRARLGDQFETPRAGLVLVLPEKVRVAGGNSFPADRNSISGEQRR